MKFNPLIIGVLLMVFGLWGGSFLVHLTPDWLDLAGCMTGAIMLLLGLFCALHFFDDGL